MLRFYGKITHKNYKIIILQKITETLVFIKPKIKLVQALHVALIPLLGFSGRENRFSRRGNPESPKPRISCKVKPNEKYEYEFENFNLQ